MIVFLNGQLIPEEKALVPITDRSFQYGDGLFETIRISNRRPFRWHSHLDRLADGANALQISVPYDADALLNSLLELVAANALSEGVVRVTLSRGVGARGYSPAGANRPILAMTLHPSDALPATPPDRSLHTASSRLDAASPIATFKTANKLVHVLARLEAEQNGAQEALLLNSRGELCEAASGNLFWIEGDKLNTPPADSGLLPGVTRAVVMKLAAGAGLNVQEFRAPADAMRQASGAFITLSSQGIQEVASLDGHPLNRSPHTRTLYSAYRNLVAQETSSHP